MCHLHAHLTPPSFPCRRSPRLCVAHVGQVTKAFDCLKRCLLSNAECVPDRLKKTECEGKERERAWWGSKEGKSKEEKCSGKILVDGQTARVDVRLPFQDDLLVGRCSREEKRKSAGQQSQMHMIHIGLRPSIQLVSRFMAAT